MVVVVVGDDGGGCGGGCSDHLHRRIPWLTPVHQYAIIRRMSANRKRLTSLLPQGLTLVWQSKTYAERKRQGWWLTSDQTGESVFLGHSTDEAEANLRRANEHTKQEYRSAPP